MIDAQDFIDEYTALVRDYNKKGFLVLGLRLRPGFWQLALIRAATGKRFVAEIPRRASSCR